MYAYRSVFCLLIILSFQSVLESKPRIFLTPLQCEGMENRDNDIQWRTVRSGLHGLWFNNAGNSVEQTRDIVLGIDRKEIPLIIPFSFRKKPNGVLSFNHPAWEKFEALQAEFKDSRLLIPEVILFDCLKVTNGEDDLDEALMAIRASRNIPEFANIRNGVTFSPRHGLDRISVSGLNDTLMDRTKAFIDEVDGMVAIEAAPWRIVSLPEARKGFINIYNYAKSRGLQFTWLMNRGVGSNNDEWIQKIEAALGILEKEGVFPDILAVSNQGDNKVPLLPAIPELNADRKPAKTISGSMLWLLEKYGWIESQGNLQKP